MKKITFGMHIITFVMFLGLLVTSDVSFAKIDSNLDEERNVYLNIMTCNKMQYHMVKDIVNDKHNVQYLFDSEKESDKFKPTLDVINNISNMDLFFYTGLDYEVWSNDLIAKVDKSNLGVIDLSRGIRIISQPNNNPYYLLGIEEYKTALYNIKNAIQDKDPLNREYYENNYNKTIININKSKENIIKNSSKIDFNNYSFITIDRNLEYFYRSLNINVDYVSVNQLNKYLEDNKLDANKIVIFKEEQTQFKNEKYNVISFNCYTTQNPKDMIIDNYKKIYYNKLFQ